MITALDIARGSVCFFGDALLWSLKLLLGAALTAFDIFCDIGMLLALDLGLAYAHELSGMIRKPMKLSIGVNFARLDVIIISLSS